MNEINNFNEWSMYNPSKYNYKERIKSPPKQRKVEIVTDNKLKQTLSQHSICMNDLETSFVDSFNESMDSTHDFVSCND